MSDVHTHILLGEYGKYVVSASRREDSDLCDVYVTDAQTGKKVYDTPVYCSILFFKLLKGSKSSGFAAGGALLSDQTGIAMIEGVAYTEQRGRFDLLSFEISDWMSGSSPSFHIALIGRYEQLALCDSSIERCALVEGPRNKRISLICARDARPVAAGSSGARWVVHSSVNAVLPKNALWTPYAVVDVCDDLVILHSHGSYDVVRADDGGFYASIPIISFSDSYVLSAAFGTDCSLTVVVDMEGTPVASVYRRTDSRSFTHVQDVELPMDSRRYVRERRAATVVAGELRVLSAESVY